MFLNRLLTFSTAIARIERLYPVLFSNSPLEAKVVWCVCKNRLYSPTFTSRDSPTRIAVNPLFTPSKNAPPLLIIVAKPTNAKAMDSTGDA